MSIDPTAAIPDATFDAPVVVNTDIITLAGQGLIIYGTWQLTEPDPSGLGEDQYGTIRKFIRIALLVGIAGTILDIMSNALSLPLPFMQMLAVVQGLAGLVGIIGFCCQLIYLSRLTMRLPDDAMSRRAKSLAWTIGISYGVVFVVGIIAALIVSGGTPGGGLAVLGCAGGIFGLAVLIAGIMYLLLLERFAKRMKAEAEMARQTWAR